MRRYENKLSKDENRPPRTLNEIDYLLYVNDIARQGALRFKTNENGDFLFPSEIKSIPPIVNLAKLLDATEKIVALKEKDNDL